MITGDATYIKKINRSLIISKIIEHGMVSRADLSKITGLNKATISVQVSDLLAEELIIETRQEHKNLGRRPIMLSINKHAGFVLGVDLDSHTITFTLSDISGFPIQTDIIELHTSDYDEILKLLIREINYYKNESAQTRYGLVGVIIGIHGIVNKDEMIDFVPKHHWQNKHLKEDLETAVGISVCIENNANLCSFAEIVYKHHQSNNLLSVNLYSGIGLGIMVNGELLKGYHGYAGEIGHIIVVPDGKPCNCGNCGCWEQYASEYSFFKQLAQKKETLWVSYEDIRGWLIHQEPVTLVQIHEFIKFLSIGLNNLINLYNPEILIINSELLCLYPNAIDQIKAQLASTVSHYRELLLSELGKDACIMGACALAIKNFLDISELKLTIYTDRLQ